jgi:GT2 family glycosyltransferase
MVAEEFPAVTLLPQARNLGFAAAQNIGIRRGTAPYVLVLNPDAAIAADTLPPLLDLLDSEPGIGCAGPALIREDGSFDHAARRSFPTPISALGHFSGIGRRVGGGALAAYRAPDVERGPVDAVNGAFMLLRRSALEEVGLFDEGYWMYMEDLDLCRRLRDSGWVTFYEPRSHATHTKAGTTEGRRGPRLNIAFHRGMGRFYRRHEAPHRNALVNLAVYVGIGLKLAISLAREALRS